MSFCLTLLVILQADGWSTLKRGDETIEVYRDRWGIPHLFAKSVADAAWAQGWCEAQDRLWQMETFRRSSKGEAAEILGPDHAAGDLDVRQRGYREDELRAMFESMSPRTREVISAYAAGVNAFIAAAKLPAKYAELKHTPRPWAETDTIAIGVAMARRFGEAGDVELQIQQIFSLLQLKISPEKAKLVLYDILRESDPRAPTTLHDHVRDGAPVPKDDKHNFIPGDPDWLAATLREHAEARAAREAIGFPAYFGSNAWVVAPRKSASGRAMLYGGPMMGFKAPSICDEVQLVAPGLNAAGMSFPGVPGVMIGWNERIAWTTTSGGADLVDAFILELNPENPGEYRWQGAWHKFESFETEIKVAGKEPRKATILRSRYGPLVGKPDTKKHRAYTLAMSFWKREQSSFEAVLDFNFAAGTAEFAKSVPKITTSHNFFVADRDGHIGFWYCGAHPKRRAGHDPRFPQKGDGSMDWEGLLPFEQWPQAVDPAHGFLANWNNKPARAWEPSGFGAIFWGQRIVDVLAQTEKLTFERVEGLARETAYHDFLAGHFLPHLLAAAAGDADPNVAKAVGLLSKYDRMKREGDPCPEIVERWLKEMLRRIFGPLFGDTVKSRDVQRYLADPLLYLLEGSGAVKYDYLGGADAKKIALAALREVVKDGLEKLAWEDHEVNFKGTIGRVKSQGGRGTFQMTVEVGPDGPRATTMAPPGASEDPGSPHFADQVELFRAWKYKPFVWRRDEMR